MRQLFGFDFMIQAYTPAAKRQFGYFPLPILHNGALVGRLDGKAHRKEGIFEVKSIYLEKDVEPDMRIGSIAHKRDPTLCCLAQNTTNNVER